MAKTTRFEAATLAFARATRTILLHSPQGLTSAELRALNDGVAALEEAAGDVTTAGRVHPQP